VSSKTANGKKFDKSLSTNSFNFFAYAVIKCLETELGETPNASAAE
jgi:hypothetical protein